MIRFTCLRCAALVLVSSLACCWGQFALASTAVLQKVPTFDEASLSTPLSPEQRNDATLLAFQAVVFDPVTQKPEFASRDVTESLASNYALVQYLPQHQAVVRQALRSGNAEIVAFVPNSAFVVRLHGMSLTQISALPGVRWAGKYPAGLKLSPQVVTGQIVANPTTVRGRTALDVMVFAGTDIDQLARTIARALPTASIDFTVNRDRLAYARVSVVTDELQAQANALASMEDVAWIEPYVQPQWLNADSVSPIQNNAGSGTPVWDQGIIGTGQRVAVADSGLDRNEEWFFTLDAGAGPNGAFTDADSPTLPEAGALFPAQKVVGYWVQPGATAYDNNQVCGTTPTGYHGTHVSGSVAGDGFQASTPTTPNYDAGDGMAPNAQILFQDIGNDTSGCLSIQDLSGTIEQARNGSAFLHSNSWGAAVGGAYNGNSASLDHTTWLLEDMMVMVAAGNSGPGSTSIGAPATAKNAMTVGALLHGNNNNVVAFSSRGPTTDGRIKPDIMAPGTSIVSARGDSNNDTGGGIPEPALTSTKSGTSMATPTVAGGAALARQYLEDGFYPTGSANPADSQVPSGALMKALLVNGATRSGDTPGNDRGWGRLYLDGSLMFDPSTDGRVRIWDVRHVSGVASGESRSFTVNVASSGTSGDEFVASLVWMDPAATPSANPTLVNDLNLTVTDPNGSVYLGNNFAAGVSLPDIGGADQLNPVEGVRISNAAAGDYTLTVSGADVPGNGEVGSDRQGFGLAVNIPACTTSVSQPPGNVLATDQGDDGIDVSFNNVAGATEYQIYRAHGSCGVDASAFTYVGTANAASFTDELVVGGFDYAYRVRGVDGCGEGPISACSSAASTGQCNLPPSFDQSTVVAVSSSGSSCGVDLSWQPGVTECPGTDLNYNVYRSTAFDFTPGPGNLLVGDLSSTSYSDTSVMPDTTYFYVVRAEDTSSTPDGNESLGSRTAKATPTGSGTVAGTFIDGADGASFVDLQLPWQFSDAQSASGALSYRNASGATYPNQTCADVTTPAINLQATSGAQLSYMARFDLEPDWDGVVVQISDDGGASWSDLPPAGGYPGDFSSTGNPPVNDCGFPASQGAFNGVQSSFSQFSSDLSAFAGEEIQIRWRFSSDPATEEEGFYLDDIQITNANVPQACTLVEEIFVDGFEQG